MTDTMQILIIINIVLFIIMLSWEETRPGLKWLRDIRGGLIYILIGCLYGAILNHMGLCH